MSVYESNLSVRILDGYPSLSGRIAPPQDSLTLNIVPFPGLGFIPEGSDST